MYKFLIDELGADFNGNGSPTYAKCVPDYLFVQFVFAFVYFIISLLILIFWGTFSGFLNGTPPLPPNQQQPEAFKVIKVPSDLIELQSAFRRFYRSETPFPHNTGEPFPGEQKVPKTVEPAVPFPVGPASAPPYPVDPVVSGPSAPAPPYPVGPAVPGPSAPATPYPVNVPPYPLHFPVYPPQPADNPFTGESADVVKVNAKKVKKEKQVKKVKKEKKVKKVKKDKVPISDDSASDNDEIRPASNSLFDDDVSHDSGSIALDNSTFYTDLSAQARRVERDNYTVV